MRTYETVRAERDAQRKAPAANSIHRSSLLIPAVPVHTAARTVTLSNHFKIKRGIDAVGMRIWGFDQQGHRVFGDHVLLDSPRVYRYDLDSGAGSSAATYQVEFFAAPNLGVPYPAAIVNYSGPGYHNAVHAFARVLNDVFEDSDINAIRVAEASIDVCVDDQHDTFLSFLTGPFGLSRENAVKLSVRLPGGWMLEAEVPVSNVPLATTTVRLSDAFQGMRLPFGAVLKIETPAQPMFFGRMMGGIVWRPDGAFSANHTYYDQSGAPEYTRATYAYSHCPLFDGLSARLVFYPIQAPSDLELFVEYFDEVGCPMRKGPVSELSSPGGDAAIIDVTGAAPSEARSFRVHARPIGGSKLPARISHQIVFGGRGLSGSVNKSLEFADEQAVEASPERPFVSWIQGVHGEQKITRIGLTPMQAEQSEPYVLDCTVYDEGGLIRQQRLEVAPYRSHVVDSRDLFGVPSGRDRYFYVYTSSLKTRVRMYSVTECLDSGHCSVEHNF